MSCFISNIAASGHPNGNSNLSNSSGQRTRRSGANAQQQAETKPAAKCSGSSLPAWPGYTAAGAQPVMVFDVPRSAARCETSIAAVF